MQINIILCELACDTEDARRKNECFYVPDGKILISGYDHMISS